VNPAVENQTTDLFALVKLTMSRCINLSALGLWKKKFEMIESKALAEQVVGAGEQWLTEWIQIPTTLHSLTNAVIEEDTE